MQRGKIHSLEYKFQEKYIYYKDTLLTKKSKLFLDLGCLLGLFCKAT